MKTSQVFAKPMKEWGGSERVAKVIYDAFDAKCYSILNQVDEAHQVEIGTPEEKKRIEKDFWRSTDDILKERRRFDMSDMLLNHKEIRETDNFIFHHPYAIPILDELDYEKAVYYNHTGSRLYTFLHDWLNQFRDPISQYAMDEMIDEFRDLRSEIYSKPDIVISNSKFIQENTKKYLGIETEVVYPPVDLEKFSPDGESAQGEYFLSFQRADWSKRLEIQIEAFRQMDDHKLVIIGGGNEDYSSFIDYYADKIPNIEYLGKISDEKLVKYIRGAKASISTAIKEDFGLTPIESMACGTPVIVGDEGGYRETVNKKVGKKINMNPQNLVRAVRNFNTRSYNKSTLREESRKYSKSRFIEEFRKASGL